MKDVKIIRVRRGFGEMRYYACDNTGNPLRGFHKLSDIRTHWKTEIRQGRVRVIRELDKTPDLEIVNETKKNIHALLLGIKKSIRKEKNRKGSAS